MLLAVAPGFLLMATGAALLVVRAVRGGSSRSPYRAMALGIGLIPLGAAVWLVVATSQPVWVKLIGLPPLVFVSALFLKRARRPPESIEAR